MIAFSPMSYQDWLAVNPDAKELDVVCDECRGTGNAECDHCGSVIDCPECDGTGKINGSLNMYNEIRRNDERLIRKSVFI